MSAVKRERRVAPRRRRAHAILYADPVMRQLMRAAGPYTLRPQLQIPPYQYLVNAIAHQQLTGAVAKRILERFRALYAPARFPEPEALRATSAEKLRTVGFSFAKIRALHDLAAKTCEGVVPGSDQLLALPDEAIIERITAVRGVGRWTVEMLLMFQLARPDVLPVDDFGVRNGFRLAYGLRAMPTPGALREFGARWAGSRSAAAWYLWRAVDLSREQRLPKPPRPAPRLKLQKPPAR